MQAHKALLLKCNKIQIHSHLSYNLLLVCLKITLHFTKYLLKLVIMRIKAHVYLCMGIRINT